MVISICTHIAATGNISHHISFIHASFDEHLTRLHILAIINSAVMNIVVHVSFLN